MTTDGYVDQRIAARERLVWQLAGMQDSSRPNYELFDRLSREFERDFPVVTPQDRSRFMSALRRATST